jgi:MFS transporter, SP family, galactose:H+ symporter
VKTLQGVAAASTQNHPFSGEKFVYVAAFIAALGGLLFGYDTGVISGAVLFITKQFSLAVFPQELVVAVVLVGAAAGALVGGRLSDRIGRRKALLVTSVIFIVGALLCAAASSLQVLIFGRVIVGVGIGLSSTTVPVYISEVSPPKARGWLVSLFQLAITIGILAAYVVDYLFAESQRWRWMLGLAVVPGVLLASGMLFLPETPRWLAENGLTEAARKVLTRIRGTQSVDEELTEIEATLSQAHERGRWSDLLLPEMRPVLVIGLGLAVFQQITGINTVIYYAPTIIQSAGIPSASGAILATAGVGVVNVFMTVVSMWLIDRVGRRPLLLTGIVGMILSLALLGLNFRLASAHSQVAWVAIVIIMLYVASFAISLGPIFWLLISEIYPLRIRGLAEGTAATTCWSANLLVSLTFLTLLQALGATWTFWMYAALALVAWIFCYILVPETKGRSLEEIENDLRKRVVT